MLRFLKIKTPKQLKDKKSFTLVEFIFAIVFTAIVITPIVIFLIEFTINTTETETNSVATALAVQKAEEALCNYNFINVAAGAGSFAAPNQSYSYNVRVDCVEQANLDVAVVCPGTNSYKKVTARVSHAGIPPVYLYVLRANY